MNNGYVIISDNGFDDCYIMSNWEDFCNCGTDEREHAHLFDSKLEAEDVVEFFYECERNDGLCQQDYKIIVV